MNNYAKEKSKFGDLIKIVIKRSQIEKWLDEPFFDDTLIGSYVKYAQQGKYMICEVMKIEEIDSKQYKLPNNKSCNKFLHLKAGKFNTITMINYISDQSMS